MATFIGLIMNSKCQQTLVICVNYRDRKFNRDSKKEVLIPPFLDYFTDNA